MLTEPLLNAYGQGPESLFTACLGLTPEQLCARPVPGRWSTLELVCHLADSEVFFTDRICRTLAHTRPLLVGVDEAPYPDALHYQQLDCEEQLDLIAHLRRRTRRVLGLVAPESGNRVAIHTDMGAITLTQIVEKTTRHLEHHLPFLAEKRQLLLGV